MQISTINSSDKSLNKPPSFGIKIGCFDNHFYKRVAQNSVQEPLEEAFKHLNKVFPGDDYLISGHGSIANPNQVIFSVTNTKTGHPLSKVQTAVTATKEHMRGVFKTLKKTVQTLQMVNALPSYLEKLNKKHGTEISFTTAITTPLQSKEKTAIFKKQLKSLAKAASKIDHTPVSITPAETNFMISLSDRSLEADREFSRKSISSHFMINPSKKEHNLSFIATSMKKTRAELNQKVAEEKRHRIEAISAKPEAPKTKRLWDKNSLT